MSDPIRLHLRRALSLGTLWPDFWKEIRQAVRPESVVLDAGSGGARERRRYGECLYIGMDNMASAPAAKYDYSMLGVLGDVTRIPLASGSVDVVVSKQVLEHVREPALAFREFARVLRPGGALYVTAPQMWHEHELPHDYFRYTGPGLRYLAESAGLEVRDVRPMGGCFKVLELALRSFYLYDFVHWTPFWRALSLPARLLLRWCSPALSVLFYVLDGMDTEKHATIGHFLCAFRPEAPDSCAPDDTEMEANA